MGLHVRGHVSVEDHTQGDHAHEGRGHRMMGSATQEANSGGAKGVQAGQGATQAKSAVCKWSRGENEAEGSGVLPGAGKGGGCASGGRVQPGRGAVHEQKVAHTVSTPLHPVD